MDVRIASAAAVPVSSSPASTAATRARTTGAPGRVESQTRIRSVAVLMPNIRRPSRGWRSPTCMGTDRPRSA